MSWLLEDPTLALSAAIVIEVVLSIALVRTGRGAIAIAMLVVFLAALGVLALEWFVITDREQVYARLESLADAALDGDADAVVGHIAPESPSIRDEARRIMERFEIVELRIASPEIEVAGPADARSATANFVLHVTSRDRRAEYPSRPTLGRLRVMFRRDGERWLVTGYEETDLIRAATE